MSGLITDMTSSSQSEAMSSNAFDLHHRGDVRDCSLFVDKELEFIKTDFAVLILVQVDNRLVHDLLELGFTKVLADHHLQHL